VAVLTSFGLVGVRLFTTDQARLRCCKADKGRLKELVRQAKAKRDKAALQRYRATLGQIALKQMRAEGKPLAVALVPVAFLAVWCFERLAYVPPRLQRPVEASLFYPASERGRLVHLVPTDGLKSEDGWIRRFEREKDDPLACVAAWKLTPDRAGEYDLTFRYKDRTHTHPLLVGGRRYSPVDVFHSESERIVSHVDMRLRKLFGIVPGIAAIGFDPWLVGYLVIVIPLVFVNKWLFRIE